MYSIKELRSSTKKELIQELEKARADVLKIRINVKTKHEKDRSKVKKIKYYIAQILTILKEIPLEEGNTKEEKSKSKK